MLYVQEHVGYELDYLRHQEGKSYQNQQQINRKKTGVDELQGRIFDYVDFGGVVDEVLIHYSFFCMVITKLHFSNI